MSSRILCAVGGGALAGIAPGGKLTDFRAGDLAQLQGADLPKQVRVLLCSPARMKVWFCLQAAAAQFQGVLELRTREPATGRWHIVTISSFYRVGYSPVFRPLVRLQIRLRSRSKRPICSGLTGAPLRSLLTLQVKITPRLHSLRLNTLPLTKLSAVYCKRKNAIIQRCVTEFKLAVLSRLDLRVPSAEGGVHDHSQLNSRGSYDTS